MKNLIPLVILLEILSLLPVLIIFFLVYAFSKDGRKADYIAMWIVQKKLNWIFSLIFYASIITLFLK